MWAGRMCQQGHRLFGGLAHSTFQVDPVAGLDVIQREPQTGRLVELQDELGPALFEDDAPAVTLGIAHVQP